MQYLLLSLVIQPLDADEFILIVLITSHRSSRYHRLRVRMWPWRQAAWHSMPSHEGIGIDINWFHIVELIFNVVLVEDDIRNFRFLSFIH